ncbi:hypothetical protein BRC88_12025 [Halobacteriales archaeon QS_4_69_225]|nr:MAG: hypothetical protein BRC88_12025 [Halobacteriales archaeon QS_4_69_225]
MDARTVVSEWETSPFDGGTDELARLGRRGFSGAVESDGDWLFVADGEAVAVVAGFETAPTATGLDGFDPTGGRRHEAAAAAAARLAPMLALGGEVRGEYFSDDTPIATVNETLSSGGFTGYLELAENVLSGDYYVVYDDGEPSYAAYLGATGEPVTGEEAETKMKNEVGIYSVVAADLPPVELPASPESAGSAAATVADRDVGETDSAVSEPGETAVSDDTPATSTDTPATGPAATDDGVGTGDSPAVEPDDELRSVPSLDPDRTDRPGDAADARATASAVEADDVAGSETTGTDDRVGTGETGPATGDPDRGVVETDETEPTTGDAGSRGAGTGETNGVGTASTGPERSAGPASRRSGGTDAAADAALGEVRAELRRLRETQERLERRVAALKGGDDGSTSSGTPGPSLSPTEALSKTTLFVREGTRGGPTLEDAHQGRTDRDALAANVELERHTRFDAAGATVGGEPYESFLESSRAYRFVRWLTTELPFEIRATDSADAMRHLYDAIPDVDRAFFEETVAVGDGDERREVTFDVVVRDREGEPLVVATLKEGREPTGAAAVEPLVTDVSDFCAANDTVAAAFVVTASYFEADATELAREATSGSLLSRGRYRNFVSLARKNGFHLCFVEGRESSLYMTLPEL